MNVPTRVPAEIAVTLVPGNGIVIRTTSFLCVLGEGSRERADAVLALGRNHPEFAGDARRLVRSLVDDLGGGQGEPADIAIAATDDLGVALYLSGSMFADMNGRLLADACSGRLELAVPWNFDSLGLYTAGVDTSGAVDAMFTLGEGAVPAAGAVIGCPVEMRVTESYRSVSPEQMPPRKAAAQPIPTPRSAPIPHPSPIPRPSPEPVPTPIQRSTPIPGAMAAPVSTADSARGATMPDVPTAHFTMAADEPMLVSLTDGDDAGHHDDPAHDKNDPAHDENDEAGVEPLPVVSGDPASAMDTTAEHHGPPVIHGIRCSRGHLNHPQSLLCGSCGIRMDQLTHIIVEGERPPLGSILFDDGSVHQLDDDLLIGREPIAPDSGHGTTIQIDDSTGQLSRQHAEIRLVEWDVTLVDVGSANGTFVVDPSADREVQLAPHQPYTLSPGSVVRLGGRQFTFETPHARA